MLTQNLYEQSDTPLHDLGMLYIDGYGNKYRYVKNGGSALVTADLCQEPAEDTQFVSMAVPAAVAIGSKEITVTNGTTTVAADDFKGGSLVISTSTGIGQKFRIVSHTTGASGAAITYQVDRPVLIALTTSSKVSVRKNPYNGIIIAPTTQTGADVGFALFALAASKYGWIQSGGDTAVRFDTGANTADSLLGIERSSAVAGNVMVSAGTSGDSLLGYSRQVVSVDSTVSIAHIIID